MSPLIFQSWEKANTPYKTNVQSNKNVSVGLGSLGGWQVFFTAWTVFPVVPMGRKNFWCCLWALCTFYKVLWTPLKKTCFFGWRQSYFCLETMLMEEKCWGGCFYTWSFMTSTTIISIHTTKQQRQTWSCNWVCFFVFLQYLLSDIAEQQLRFVKNGKKQPVTLHFFVPLSKVQWQLERTC